MHQTDSKRFLVALNRLASMLLDELNDARMEGYWVTLGNKMSIDEFEGACRLAMERETFHKVPLPAVLIGYAQEYREAQALEAKRAERALAEQRRLALEADPVWQAQERQRRIDAAMQEAENIAWRAQQSRETLIELGLLNPPNPNRWVGADHDDLTYTPSVDIAARKAQLRAQLDQLMKETALHDDRRNAAFDPARQRPETSHNLRSADGATH